VAVCESKDRARNLEGLRQGVEGKKMRSRIRSSRTSKLIRTETQLKVRKYSEMRPANTQSRNQSVINGTNPRGVSKLTKTAKNLYERYKREKMLIEKNKTSGYLLPPEKHFLNANQDRVKNSNLTVSTTSNNYLTKPDRNSVMSTADDYPEIKTCKTPEFRLKNVKTDLMPLKDC